MRQRILGSVALGIALAISPAAGFAKGGGSGGNAEHSPTAAAGAGTGSKAPYFIGGGPGGAGQIHQRPLPGNKPSSNKINCKAGGEGCGRQH
jgi:hypothetical protein